jgi:cytoskeletal protein CcmA (bactofilin family)
MVAQRSSDDSSINSIVGSGTFLRGHVELSGLMRIDGDFSGSVKTTGRVIVGQGGRADCAIEAGTVVVGGLFRGEIVAHDKVVLLASSVVIGTVNSPKLVAEGGVLFSGRLIVNRKPVVADAHRDSERRKELLMETVRKREGAAAAPSPEPAESEREGRVAVAPGTTGRWSE